MWRRERERETFEKKRESERKKERERERERKEEERDKTEWSGRQREREREDRYTRLLINYPLRSLRRYNKIISGRLYRDSGCERPGRHKVAACAPTAAVINKATQPEKRRAA